jgi:hypothetical protein
MHVLLPPVLQICGKLSGSHKGSITVLRSLPKAGTLQDMLVAGDSMGGVHVWEPFGRVLTMADKEAMPRFTFQAHDKEVCSIVLATGMEEIDKAVPRWGPGGGRPRAGACPARCA